jgi:hypothetical protein
MDPIQVRGRLKTLPGVLEAAINPLSVADTTYQEAVRAGREWRATPCVVRAAAKV